ncbi:MAG: LuxR C-terminal-related transcriptional regulator [Candidatus Limosilactobacillus merdavium]|uniref:LuxR C-terminal-related transcriptional regulator n=1 Tax=Candidatus Limosilactobacillus merdavium TaxID=2838651 RepID=A0A9E2KWA0_9LACO|nr:LuxR C-terminal-related transcriptional regulator [Candidatus Limosilactobacillus merdavium]
MERVIKNSSRFERQVLALIVTGYSVEHVCRKLNCKKRQVQSALSRSRNKLIKILAAE